jgi:glycopeptide antibiotics resistance protein
MISQRPKLHVSTYRITLFLSIIIIIPLGYWIRFSQGPAPLWVYDLLGSVAYEMFWILLVIVLVPRISRSWTAIGVCLTTCGLEFLQLWTPPVLQAIRATLLGRILLGNTFSWSDFPSYFIGSFLGWVWVSWLAQNFATNRR